MIDAVTELGRNPVSKHQIQPEYGDEQTDAGRDCRTRLARPNSQARAWTGKNSFFFSVQLTTSRVGNLTRLIHTFAVCVTIQYQIQTPASVVFDLGPKIIHEKEGDWPYKQAIGGLLWISGMTRPDTASAVRAVARYTHNPAARHRKAVRKIISYLKATKDLGVVFRRRGDLKLSLFVYANYADGSHSTIGGGGDVTILSPFWEETARKQPLPDIFDQPRGKMS